MSEHQAARQPVDLSLSAAAKKPDSQLRLVGADEHVLFPEDGRPNDQAATIISKNKPRAANTSVTTGEMLAGKSLRGQRLAHFELLEPIGVGGMAAVILARDTQLDRFVALKILPPEMANDVENVRRFNQEAKAAAKLNHENIARVFFCGEDKDLHFIAFEYVEGENLRTLLEAHGRLPVREAVSYILQVATGLEHAASRGVVHRDIKPSNIIITPTGKAKLVDMGLARNAETHSDQALTQSGVTLGTFDYISPEQALEPREADVRSDIYSLGCTFYHMLTGQAPVPEGTAAKKLYHHQHLAPIDPRQYNPEIPDEIAAILMRMMAKDPKERYQKPVHLIQHLMQVAQKVGVASEMPEGVMFLDAALPGAPRFRPILTVALAALALGVLLMLVSLGPAHKGTVLPPPSVEANGTDSGSPLPRDNPGNVSVSPRPNTPETVTTLPQLARLAADKNRSGKILLEKEIDLDKGLHWTVDKKQPLVIRSEKSATLKFTYRPGDQDGLVVTRMEEGPVAGLEIDADGPVTFENIRFELNAADAATAPVAMVLVRGPGQVRFLRCTFVENVPLLDKTNADMPFTGVLLDNSMDEKFKRFHVNFVECLWERGGQAAVTANGPGKIFAQNCGFGPHAALFRLRGNSMDPSELTMLNCSAFVTQGPAFRLDDSHSCWFKIMQSIFSCPETPGDDVQLIRQADMNDLVAKYDGLRNVYHNLKGFWSPDEAGNVDDKLNLDDFRRRLGVRGKDDFSVVLTSSPWADPDPLKKLLLKQPPKEAFQVTSKLREVRSADGRKALGIERCVWGSMEPLVPLPTSPSDVRPPLTIQFKPNEKVVDPDAPDGLKGVYNSVSKALLSAETGDVLLVKHGKNSRDVALNTLNLPESKSLTLKPYPEFHPVFVLSTQEKGAAMFRLLDGALHFEGLEFALEPEAYDEKGQTVVAMLRNGACSFKNCVITLRQAEQQKRSPLSALALLDLDGVMAMPTSPAAVMRSQPQVTFTDSLIRGEGDLVNVKSSRPFELKIDNTVAGLAGSLLLIQGAGKDLAGEMVMPGVVKISNLSAFLSEPAIVLRAAKSGLGLAPTRCDLLSCLFVAPPDRLVDRPFVALEGVELREETLGQLMEWKGEKNVFVNMTRMLDVSRPNSAMSLGNLDAEGWKAKMEMDASFFDKSVRFIMPWQLRPFSRTEFDHYRPTQSSSKKLAGFGANLNPDVLPRFTAPRKLEAGP